VVNVSEVGAFPVAVPGGFQITFGVYLPGIRAADDFDVVVRVIHRDDRFNPAILPQDSHLLWNSTHPLDLWSATVPVQPIVGTHFGSEGLYLTIASSSGSRPPVANANL